MILVTGATGFVGRHVVAELARAGHRVRALARPTSNLAPIRPWLADVAYGDVTDPDSLPPALAGCEAVVHLVAIRRQWGARTFAVTAVGTAHVARAAAAAGVRHLVHVSALGLTDRPATGYMRGKAAAEQAVRQCGVPFTILRPSFIVGAGGFVQEYGDLIRRAPVVPVPGTGAYPVQPVAAADVALACRRALEVPAAAGKTYDLAGPERISFREFIRRIRDAMGSKKPLVPVPLAVMWPVAAVLQRLTPNPPATTEEITMLVAGNVGDPGPAVRDLGLQLTPLDQAIREAVRALYG